MAGLSGKTMDVYEYIVNYTVENRYPPTIREIADAMNYDSTYSVKYQLRLLEEAKYLTVVGSSSRAIRLNHYCLVPA